LSAFRPAGFFVLITSKQQEPKQQLLVLELRQERQRQQQERQEQQRQRLEQQLEQLLEQLLELEQQRFLLFSSKQPG
jgi:hypothetical protein